MNAPHRMLRNVIESITGHVLAPARRGAVERRFLAALAVGVICTCACRAAEIHDLVAQGDLEPVRELLAEDPGQLNARAEDGSTPLHAAAYGGHAELVELLLARGASVDATTVNGSTPLHGAAYGGHVDCARRLMDAGADPMTPNSSGYTPFHGAAAGGSVEAVKLFLDSGVDINAQKHGGATALIIAALGDHYELTEWLLKRGADTEIRDNYGRTPLLLVARERGNVPMARLLLDNGAEIDALDRGHDTPLMLAAWRGFRDLVNLLIERGADVQATGPVGDYLTSHAAEKGLAELFTILSENGADLGIRNANGGGLLHSAAEGGSVEIVAALLDLGFDVNETDRYGWTPLHYAAERGRNGAAEKLIAAGADIERPTLAGHTAFSVATEHERDEILRLLEAGGANTTLPAFPELTGPYFGQTPPGREPKLFAVDIVSSNRFEHGSVTFSPDGTEAFWSSSYFLSDSGYSYSRILTARVENGRWIAPRMAAFSGVQQSDDVPLFSNDGRRLYFMSRRPMDEGGGGRKSIWFIDRTESGWSDPVPVRGGLNSMGHHWQFAVAANGNVYFGSADPSGHGRSDLYVSRFVDGTYLEPENLGDVVNSEFDEGNPFVAPDESYLIITRFGHPDGLGDADLFLSFRDAQGQWMEPVPLPAPINSRGREICPNVTADGRYLFFNSFRAGDADIYWVSADVIDQMRPGIAP